MKSRDKGDPGMPATAYAAVAEAATPILRRALARLQHEGWALSSDDQLDLVQDFITYRLPRAIETYQPHRELAPWLYVVFIREARRTLRRNRRLSDRLEPWQESQGVSAERPAERPTASHDLEAVRRAMAGLAPEEQLLLTHWLGSGASLRALADQLKTSRYQIRQRLLDALSKVIASFPEGETTFGSDWRVVQAVFGQGGSLTEAAGKLHTTEAAITRAIARVRNRLGRLMMRS